MTFRGKALYASSNYYGLMGRLREEKMDSKIDARVLILNDRDQILLVLEREKKVEFSSGEGFVKPSKWGFPGGRSECCDEDEIAVAKREVEEETGIWVDVNSRLRFARHGEKHLKVLFIGYPAAGEIKINPEEILDCRWFPRKILYDEKFDMYSGHRRMGQEILRKLRR